MRNTHSALAARTAEQAAEQDARRVYASPADLEKLYPYSRHSWRLWYYEGRLEGCRKPNGKRGRLLIPLDVADRVILEGLPPAVKLVQPKKAAAPAAVSKRKKAAA